jgi:hypothetical protein
MRLQNRCAAPRPPAQHALMPPEGGVIFDHRQNAGDKTPSPIVLAGSASSKAGFCGNGLSCRWVGALGTRRVVILWLYAAVLASFFGPGPPAGQLAVHLVRIMTGIWRPVMRRA